MTIQPSSSAGSKDLHNCVYILLSALREFEEAVGEKYDDEGGDIAAIEREFHADTLGVAQSAPDRGAWSLHEIQSAADAVVSRVNEWDDRTSPDDFPEALLITSSELHRELVRFAEDIGTLSAPTHPTQGGDKGEAVTEVRGVYLYEPAERGRLCVIRYKGPHYTGCGDVVARNVELDLAQQIVALLNGHAPQPASNAQGAAGCAIRWQRVNDEPFEYAIQQGPHGDEFVKLLDGTCLRRGISGIAYAAKERHPRVIDLAEKVRTAKVDQIGPTRFAVITLIIPEGDIGWFADAIASPSVTSTQNSPPVELAPQNSAERIPSSDAGSAGGDAAPSTSRAGPMVPWELDCKQTICTAPKCDCPAASSADRTFPTDPNDPNYKTVGMGGALPSPESKSP